MADYDYDGFGLTAYIDSDGDLIFEDGDGDVVAIHSSVVHPDYEKSDSSEIVRRFYPGDKITITF